MEVLHLNKASFEKLTAQTEKAVLIDFWAEWCGPCQKLGPELEKLAAAHPEIIIGKLEVSDDPENIAVAAALGVSSIPAMFFYRSGKLEKQIVGFKSAEELESELGL